MRIKEILFIIAVFIEIIKPCSSIHVWPSCEENPIDLVIVLDGSGSVGQNRFGLFKELVQNLVRKLNVGKNGTKVALMQLSDSKATKFEFGINNYSDVSMMVEAIDDVKYQYGKFQETEFAMRMVETQIFNGENITDRAWAQNVVVLIAEGPSTYPAKKTNALKEVTHLKNSGVQLVTIGVGRKITSRSFQEELYAVASSPQYVFFTSDDDILNLVQHLEGKLCPNTTDQRRPDQPVVISTKVITSVMVKTTTVWMTSYISAPATCPTPTAVPTCSAVSVTPAICPTPTALPTCSAVSVTPAICPTPTALPTCSAVSVTPATCPTPTALPTCSPVSVTPAICPTPTAVPTSSVVSVTPTTSMVKLLHVPTVVEKKEVRKNTKKTNKKFSGKLLECFTCEYNDNEAKEFSIDCGTEVCAPDQIYCADAVLEHLGKQFVRKRCATSQFCNSTSEQCVRDFQHTAEYTDCSVKCCGATLCNPYSQASHLDKSLYMKLPLAAGILMLVRCIMGGE